MTRLFEMLEKLTSLDGEGIRVLHKNKRRETALDPAEEHWPRAESLREQYEAEGEGPGKITLDRIGSPEEGNRKRILGRNAGRVEDVDVEI